MVTILLWRRKYQSKVVLRCARPRCQFAPERLTAAQPQGGMQVSNVNRPDFRVKLADTPDELRAAQRLRYEVFVRELGGGGDSTNTLIRS